MVEASDDPGLQYWRARAEALEDEIDLLRELAWRLAEGVPASDLATIIEAGSTSARVLPEDGATPVPCPSDIKIEMQRIWGSLTKTWRQR